MLLAYDWPGSRTPCVSGVNLPRARSRLPTKYSQGFCGEISSTHWDPSLNRLGHSMFHTARSRYWKTTPRCRHSVRLGLAASYNCTAPPPPSLVDRKSTRLNSSHLGISYAV